MKTSGDENPLLKDPIAQDNIRQAIEQQLAARGIRRVNSNPSFYLSTHFYVEKDERSSIFSFPHFFHQPPTQPHG